MLLRELEAEMQLKKDQNVLKYLHQVAAKLKKSNASLRELHADFNLYRHKVRKPSDQKWRIYILPKNQIYLPIELIKQLSYENELAGVLALAFAHFVEENMIELLREYWEKQSQIGTEQRPISLSVFHFNEKMEIKASALAVNYMYQAGYDARGLTSVYGQFQKNSDYSPFDLVTIDEAILAVRKELAVYPPLLNPVVQTHEFLTIKKRILNL